MTEEHIPEYFDQVWTIQFKPRHVKTYEYAETIGRSGRLFRRLKARYSGSVSPEQYSNENWARRLEVAEKVSGVLAVQLASGEMRLEPGSGELSHLELYGNSLPDALLAGILSIEEVQSVRSGEFEITLPEDVIQQCISG